MSQEGATGSSSSHVVKRKRGRFIGDNTRAVKQKPECGDVTKGKTRVALGHSTQINARRQGRFATIISLITSEKRALQITNNKLEVLRMEQCSHALYMEWAEDEEAYLLWAQDALEGSVIKFEIHEVFEVISNNVEVIRPLLIFSNGFTDGVGWEDIKNMLMKLFGSPDHDAVAAEHDYLYVFTKLGNKIYFQNYKISRPVTPDNNTMELVKMSPSFILKPLMLENLETSSFFIDDHSLIPEADSTLSLISRNVLMDTSSAEILICHDLHLPDVDIGSVVLLPAPEDWSRLDGYNSTYEEYFQRYNSVKRSVVPGTGPAPSVPATANNVPSQYYQISAPVKIFVRSFLHNILMFFKQNVCLVALTSKNILLRKGRVALYNVSLHQQTTKRAKRNLRAAKKIIKQALGDWENLPNDVKAAIKLLGRSEDISDLSSVVNAAAWMEPLSRNHMLEDLQNEFSLCLSYHRQFRIINKLPYFSTWEVLRNKNWILVEVASFNAPKNQVAWKKRKEAEVISELNDLLKNEPPAVITAGLQMAPVISEGRRYFKSLRNSVVHLPETIKKHTQHAVTAEIVDLILSSEFAEVYSVIQKEVAIEVVRQDAFGNGPDPVDHVPGSLFERFNTYFSNNELPCITQDAIK